MQMQERQTDRLTPSDLREYFVMVSKPCHGKCVDGWYHVAYSPGPEAGLWNIYRLPCKCTYPGGIYYDELIQNYRYNREPDYQSPWRAGILMHPKNLDRLSGKLKTLFESHREQKRLAEQAEDEGLPF
jgi:hypothetical protein